jgi:DNA-binding LacI/PurR family transcriptional regulator
MPAGPIGATGTVALVVPRPQGRDSQLDDPFFLELVAGISDGARERGCDLLISHFTPTSFDDLTAAMTTSRADGVIFLGKARCTMP